MKAILLLFLFNPILPTNADKVDLFFASHEWKCDSEKSCEKECLAVAKEKSVDPEICDYMEDEDGPSLCPEFDQNGDE